MPQQLSPEQTPLELLRQLVAIPSVTGQENALALFCEAYLQTQGFVCERQFLDDGSGRFNLLASRGLNPELLLYAHHDTVPADPDWIQDPFDLTESGDQLLGLGVSDMKGGMAAILSAAASSSRPVRVVLGADEEAWSAGAWQLVNSGWCKGLKAILVPELSIDSEHEHLGIGRRGHESFVITLKGQRRHGAVAASQTDLSPAIERAAELVLALREYALQTHILYQQAEALLIRGIHAQSVGFSLPDTCQIELSVLTLPGRKQNVLLQELTDFIAPYGALIERQLRPTPLASAYAVADDEPLIKQIQMLAQQTLDLDLEPVLGVSVADENVLATLGIPVLSLAPVGGRSHRAGEWLSLRSLERVTALYGAILESLNLD